MWTRRCDGPISGGADYVGAVTETPKFYYADTGRLHQTGTDKRAIAFFVWLSDEFGMKLSINILKKVIERNGKVRRILVRAAIKNSISSKFNYKSICSILATFDFDFEILFILCLY